LPRLCLYGAPPFGSVISNDPMRLPAVFSVLLLLAAAGCAPQRPERAAAPVHPNLIVVREFAFSPGVITLDPSFGFSLYRGMPGVPPRRRADAVGRAAAFTLADETAQQLRNLGYDAVEAASGGPEPGGRALVVTGAFRHIYEGHRRQDASIEVDAEIGYQGAGAGPQRLQALSFDSRTVPRVEIAGRHGTDVNFAAKKVADALARAVAALARYNNWPGPR
jgi:hypothetical protein